MVYQYLGEEEKDAAKMKRIGPYAATPAPPAPVPSSYDSPPAPAPQEPASYAPAPVPVVPQPAPPVTDQSPGVIPSGDYVGTAPDDRRPNNPDTAPVAQPAPAPPPGRARPARAHEDRSSPTDMPTPAGFVRRDSRHFTIFSEQYPASDRFIDLVENLHSNLMLDLAPFSPWASSERTMIFLFKNQDTYRRVTGRPVWSGGASSVGKRKLYVYESEELPGIVAHELTHIYFDGFFLEGTTDPLWLSEGMATLVQVERGLAAPNWLRENLEKLEAGEGYPIEKLIAVTSTAGWPDAKVRLWYAQSYSLVRFLIRTQYRSSFYKFSAHLRDGRPTPEALYRAYGAPYTRMVALEHAWRYELSRASMAKLGAQ